MSILDHFDLDISAQVTREVETNDGNDNVVKTPVVIGTYDCLKWAAGSSEAFKSERFKEEVTTTLAFYPDADIKANDELLLDDGTKHHVLGADNIGEADEVLIAYCKEIT